MKCERQLQRLHRERRLTGRSTGGATAGRLARVAQLAYPPPRGQGSLPRLPGYLYVRPHKPPRSALSTAAEETKRVIPCLSRASVCALRAHGGNHVISLVANPE